MTIEVCKLVAILFTRIENSFTQEVRLLIIGIEPTVDFVFKLVLGSPQHPRLTIHFLNAVLRRSARITQVTIENPILGKEFTEDKLAVLDILATDEYQRKFDVEMQTTLPAGSRKRLAYYNSTMYAQQLTEGEDYPNLRPAISICVLDATMFPDSIEIYRDFRLRDEKGNALTEDLQIHTIELPKYTRPDHNEKITDPLEQWLYFFRYAAVSTAEELSAWLADDVFTEAIGVLEMIAKTPSQRTFYEARLKFQRDERARLLHAKEEGREEGEARGQQMGEIRMLQKFLGIPESSSEELSRMDLTALEVMAADLQSQLPSRPQS